MVFNVVTQTNMLCIDPQYFSGLGVYIPRVMLVFAFFASLIWTILKIIELVNRKPSLEFRITREFFLRIFESGECFYTNAVLVAYNAVALIESLEVKLNKGNGSTKSFNLNVISFGEKVRSEHGVANYYFHSTSPLYFLGDSMPQRITYLFSQEHYAESIQKAYRDFSMKILELKQRYAPVTQENNEEELAQAGQEILRAIQETCSKIVDSVQIEPGNYQLRIKVHYRQRGRIFPFYCKKRAESSLKFVVESNVREVLRGQVYQYVGALAGSILFDKKPPLITPEYVPVKISEET